MKRIHEHPPQFLTEVKKQKTSGESSCYALGMQYKKGQGVLKSASMALAFFEAGALQGDCLCMYEAGCLCEMEVRDYKKAAKYFECGAESGHIDSLYRIALLHLKKLYPEANIQAGLHYLEKAIAMGHAMAWYYKGQLFLADGYEDIGIHKDYLKAKQCFEIAVEKHCPHANSALGHMYSQGLYMPIDIMKVLKYYRKANQLGANLPENIHVLQNMNYAGMYDIRAVKLVYFMRHVLLSHSSRFASIISVLDKAGCFDVLKSTTDYGTTFIPIAYKNIIWDKFCIYQSNTYKKNAEEYWIWSLMVIKKEPKFFLELFACFPNLMSAEACLRFMTILNIGWPDAQEQAELQTNLIKIETGIEKEFLYNRYKFFASGIKNIEYPQQEASQEAVKMVIPKEITQHIFENMQNVNMMPW